MAFHQPLMCETVWFDQQHYETAEVTAATQNRTYHAPSATQNLTLGGGCGGGTMSTVRQELAQVRQQIHSTLTNSTPSHHYGLSASHVSSSDSKKPQHHASPDLCHRIDALENSYKDIVTWLKRLESRFDNLEKATPSSSPTVTSSTATARPIQNGTKKAESDDDDDVDLFGSDEEEVDEEAERIKQERLDAYAAKKAKKPGVIAKSNIILFVKPWDDETDMKELERSVRSISLDGLVWGPSKLVPVGYGINKLQIGCVVEDDRVGTDLLEEEITAFEDFVQSVDIAAFNKV